MQIATPNIIAVIIMALVYMGLGALWYSKALFGKILEECCTVDKKEKMEKEKCCGPKGYIGGFIIALILGYVLAHFVNASGAQDAAEGMKVGICAWFGFVATTMFSGVLWCKKPLKAFFIDAGFMLVIMGIMGSVFALWH